MTAPIDELTLARLMPVGLAQYCSDGDYTLAKHIKILNQKLMDVAAGRINRLIIQMPPRHSKSETASKWFPFWLLGRFPRKRVLLTSYEAEFAAEWGEKVRDLMDEHGEKIFGVRVSKKKRRKNNWSTEYLKNGEWKEGGYMKTAGAGGALVGKGADVLIIDDPVKNEEQARSKIFHEHQHNWFRTAVRTRLQKGAAVILILTRWTNDDLAGRLLEDMEIGSDQWEVLSLPAICEDPENDPLGRKEGEALWPEMFDEEYMRVTKIAMDIWWWALYQQTPQDNQGGQFKYEWWKEFKEIDITQIKRYGLFIDSSFKTGVANDWSVIAHWTAMKDGTFKVLREYRKKMEFPDLIMAIHSEFDWAVKATGLKPHIYIEDKASGQSAIQTLSRPMYTESGKTLPRLPVVAWLPPGNANMSKEARADRVTVFVKAGMVELPHGERWVVDFKKEHAQFPRGKWDDRVDTTTAALLELGDITNVIKFSVVGAGGIDKTIKLMDDRGEPRTSYSIADDPYYARAKASGWY